MTLQKMVKETILQEIKNFIELSEDEKKKYSIYIEFRRNIENGELFGSTVQWEGIIL